MSTYRQLKGYSIKKVSSNPDNPQEGQVWYNSTELKLKARIKIPAAWSSGPNIGTGREQVVGTGTSTAGLIAGGLSPAGTDDATEEYNGTSYSEQNDMSQSRRIGAFFGIQTAAVFAGGFIPPAGNNVEHYGGSSWTSGGNLPSTRSSSGGAGTQTAGVIFGGFTGGPPYDGVTTTQEYDGSSWTNGGALNTARRALMGDGTQTAALAMGGDLSPGTVTGSTEEYNGSAWTEGGTMGTARYSYGSSKAGTQSAAFAFGGLPGNLATSEKYNGSTWSADSSMANGRGYGAGFGTQTTAVMAGGSVPPKTNITEEYADTTEPTRSFDVS